ncbi:MAG: SRPBCC family protein [Acidimicrobiales bacterium]
MAAGKSEVSIARSPADVWAVVGRFDGVEEWMPGIDACEMEGDVRKFQSMGVEARERLLSRDDDARTLSYSLIEGPVPVEHHVATITVTPDGERARLEWAYEVRPDELEAIFGPVYESSAQAVKTHLEA